MAFRPGVLLHKNITLDRIIFKNTACTLWRTSRDEGAYGPRISSVKGLPVIIAPILQMIIDSPEVRHLGNQGPKDQGLLLPNSGVILELLLNYIALFNSLPVSGRQKPEASSPLTFLDDSEIQLQPSPHC